MSQRRIQGMSGVQPVTDGRGGREQRVGRESVQWEGGSRCQSLRPIDICLAARFLRDQGRERSKTDMN